MDKFLSAWKAAADGTRARMLILMLGGAGVQAADVAALLPLWARLKDEERAQLEKDARAALLSAAAIEELITSYDRARIGRLVRCVQGNLDGRDEFAELWPSLVMLTEDEKAEVRLSLGFDK